MADTSHWQVGMTVHDLTLLKKLRIPGKPARWNCRCACGNEKEIAAADLGVTQSCGCHRWNTLNETFFDVPTKDNCYWAGFIAADGCIVRPTGLSLQLAIKDIALLHQLGKTLEWKGQVREYERWTSNKRRKMRIAVLAVSSKALVQALYRNFSITPRKSLTLQPPSIQDPDLVKAFILGYIDGDGSIGIWGKTRSPTLKVLGTRELLDWVSTHFNTFCPAKKLAAPRKKGAGYEGNQWVYCVSGKRAIDLVRFLRTGSVQGLDRKWGILENDYHR